MRHVPITMATQHPDNAGAPWWKDGAFVSTQDEIEEVMLLFRKLPIDEYMWDWEGKYVDEAVGEKLFSRGHDFFSKRPLGKDLRLTYRIPAFDGVKMHRMARAFMNILSLSDLAHELRLPELPVREMFLPLTTKASQPRAVRRVFREIAEYHRKVFHSSPRVHRKLLASFDVTPLVEDVSSLLSIEKILSPYWKELLRENPEARTRGQRVFLARSDPAMNAGLVPAVLAVKVALSTIHDLSNSLKMPVYPILGTGSLPFRGSVNPTYTSTFLEQYAGVRTYSIQSGFRYDYPLKDVIRSLSLMKRDVPKYETVSVSKEDRRDITKLCDACTRLWRPTVEAIAPLINTVASHVPARRERLQHIGLFGYSRGIGKVRLPRAIGFTAALYSIGIPPELIATGRGLLLAKKEGLLPLIEKYYPALRADLQHAGKYLNTENLHLLARRSAAMRDIEHDIRDLQDILGISLGPKKEHHLLHRNLTSNIYHRVRTRGSSDRITRDIVEAGVIRRSLG